MKDRGFFDAKSFFKEVREFESELQNTVHSDVTQLYDYDSLVSLRIQRQSPLLYVEDEKREAVASLSLCAYDDRLARHAEQSGVYLHGFAVY